MDRPIRQLDRLGPDSDRPPVTTDDAMTYVRGLTGGADENFHVLSRFVPADARDDFAAVYAFCRWADDLADETHALGLAGDDARAESLRLLAWWREELAACFAGEPRHPVFVALARSAERRGLTAEPFDHLIDAFEQDQRQDHFGSWDELLGYCRKSADPVGRIVLRIAGCDASDETLRWSDDVCTGLQLVNFWQDVRRDLLERGRVYIPAETGINAPTLRDWIERPNDPEARVPYIKMLRGLLERTTPMFESSEKLIARIDPAYRPVISLFAAGGRATGAKIERAGCTTLWKRPVLSKLDKAALLARAWGATKRRAATGRAA